MGAEMEMPVCACVCVGAALGNRVLCGKLLMFLSELFTLPPLFIKG